MHAHIKTTTTKPCLKTDTPGSAPCCQPTAAAAKRVSTAQDTQTCADRLRKREKAASATQGAGDRGWRVLTMHNLNKNLGKAREMFPPTGLAMQTR